MRYVIVAPTFRRAMLKRRERAEWRDAFLATVPDHLLGFAANGRTAFIIDGPLNREMYDALRACGVRPTPTEVR